MKRRNFIRNIGLSVPPLMVLDSGDWQNPKKELPDFKYKQPESLNDAISKEGQIVVRLEFQSNNRVAQEIKPQTKIINGNILRSKSFFFEKSEDNFTGSMANPVMTLAQNDVDIIVLWLDKFSPETQIEIKDKKEHFHFSLSEIVQNNEVNGEIGEVTVKANLLLDREIGELDPANVGIKNSGDDFTFILMADPQGGDASNPEDNLCRMKIHNAFIEESIKLAAKIKANPAFCLIVGDVVDHQGEAHHFVQMGKFFENLKMPVLYAMGNHESRYNTTFGPGYNFDGFANFFAAQKAINSTEFLLYSFNLGKWHFVVWPDPLRQMFWENHPHYFDWLERDLEKYKDRPTIFFQHIPMHPVGINPLDNYCETPYIKSLLFDILTKHGNVKTIFSGHVHIPVKSSLKTAMNVNGINCINLPAAGYRPRGFGEEDFYGGPSQGICVVDIKRDKLSATYKTVTLEEFTYPEELPHFEAQNYPLWFGNKWNLPANQNFVNGDFSQELNGWGRKYVYLEDENPSNICEVRKHETASTPNALYLKTEKRGYHAPGQDRLPQDVNRIFQAIEPKKGKNPVIAFEYLLDGKNCDFNGINGFYIWVEGYLKSAQLVNLMYFANYGMTNLGSTYARSKGTAPLFFSLNNSTDSWHKVQLNIKTDFETNSEGFLYSEPEPDRLIVTAGIWNINDGESRPFAAYLNNFRVDYDRTSESQINGKKIKPLPDEKKWWLGKTIPWENIAGEHHYFVEGWEKLKY